MRCALYARRSKKDDNKNQRATEEKSVTVQVEEARTFIANHNLGMVAEDFIVIDDGISGANFSTRQLLGLVQAARTTPRPFDALVANALDRVGREQFRTNAAFLDLIEAGVKVYLLDDGGQELRLDTPIAKAMVAFRSYAAEDFRHQIKVKTRQAMHHKAGKGHVAGGKIFGYDNHRLLVPLPDGKVQRGHVERRVREDQAAVVRRLFEMTAAGLGLDRIARTLTAERVPPPRGDGRGWAPSAIRDMLRNELYRGVIVWGRSERIYRAGRRGQQRRDPSQWLRLPAEHLRIVSEELWQAAHAVLAKKAETFKREVGGQLIGRSVGTRSSRYLLSGLSRCGVCEGSMFAYSRGHRQGDSAAWYRCHLHASRGPDVCTNRLWIPMADVDRLLLDAVRESVLVPSAVDGYLDAALAQWSAERAPAAARRGTLADERRQVEVEIAGLERQLIDGAPWTLIAEPLTARRQRRDTLRAELAHVEAHDRVGSDLAAPALRRILAEELEGLRAALTHPLDEPEEARRVLMRLLDGERIVFQPLAKGKGCEISGYAGYNALLADLREFGRGPKGTRSKHADRRDSTRPPSAAGPWIVQARGGACLP